MPGGGSHGPPDGGLLPDPDPDPEQSQPQVLEERSHFTAMKESTEHQTHAQQPEHDHAGLVGFGLEGNVATIGVGARSASRSTPAYRPGKLRTS